MALTSAENSQQKNVGGDVVDIFFSTGGWVDRGH